MTHRTLRLGLTLLVGLAFASALATASAQGVTLNVLTTSSTPALWDEIVSLFEAENPNVDVRVTAAALEQHQVALLTQLAAGNPPDVMYVLPGGANPISSLPLAEAGHLADLSAEPWVSRIPAGFKAGTEYDGKTVIYPTGQALIGMLVNHDVFEANGIEIPRTYDELLLACDAFSAAGIIPIVQGNLTPWVPQLVTYNIVPSTVYGPEPDFSVLQAAGERTFAGSEGWNAVFDKTGEMLERGCYNDNPNGTTVDQMVEALGTGDAAISFMLTAAMGRIQPYVDAGGRFSLQPFPAVNDADQVYVLAFPLNSYGVSSRSRNPEEAKAFVEFLTRPDIIQLFVNVSRDIPILITDGIELDPILAPILETVAAGRSVTSPDQHWPNTMVQQEHIAVMQEFFAGRVTGQQALERMDRAYNED